jgi:hypothetical protein
MEVSPYFPNLWWENLGVYSISFFLMVLFLFLLQILPMNEGMWGGVGPPHLELGHMSIDDSLLDLSPVDEAPEVLNLEDIFPDRVEEIW